jgi:hypothetical protein
MTSSDLPADDGADRPPALEVAAPSVPVLDFEREADAYAIETLERNGIPPSHLASILERMTKGDSEGGVLAYVSSHPATAERLAALRK